MTQTLTSACSAHMASKRCPIRRCSSRSGSKTNARVGAETGSAPELLPGRPTLRQRAAAGVTRRPVRGRLRHRVDRRLRAVEQLMLATHEVPALTTPHIRVGICDGLADPTLADLDLGAAVHD